MTDYNTFTSPPLDIEQGEQPLLPPPETREQRSFKESLAEKLESAVWHWIIIILTNIDALFVIIDIGFKLVRDPGCVCDGTCESEPPFSDALEVASLVITTFFLLEIPANLYSFGTAFYTSHEHYALHLFDAVVIILTFVFETCLRGEEAQVASLLVLLRLWRIVKLVSSVSVGITEINEVSNVEVNVQRPDENYAQNESDWNKERHILLQELEQAKDTIAELKEELEKAKSTQSG